MKISYIIIIYFVIINIIGYVLPVVDKSVPKTVNGAFPKKLFLS